MTRFAPFVFPFYRQRDAMDCGPTCLLMIAASYGRQFSLPHLRNLCHISREGVSALGIMEAAEQIGFRTMTVKVPFDSGKNTACLLNAPLPCIAHWNQRHFVVVYKANNKKIWIADPASGKHKLNRQDFENAWISASGQGILVLLEPTPNFYKSDFDYSKESAGLTQVTGYVQPYRHLILQVATGMALGSMILLAFPLLTQSIVDYGINNRNIDFITLILIAQLTLFISQVYVQFLQSRIILFVGARINVSMVNDFLSKLMQLPISFFDTKLTGDLLQRIGDQTRIETFITRSALPVMFALLNFLVFSCVLLSYNGLIFWVFILFALLYLFWIFIFLHRRKELDYLRFQQSGENNNNIIEIIQGMQEIKMQGSERKRRWIWAGTQARLFQTSLRSLTLAQWQEAGAAFFTQSKNIIITFLTAKSVIDGQMTLGMMLAVQYMVGQLDAPLQQFVGFIRSAQDAKISLERLNEVQSQPVEGEGLPAKPIFSGAGNGIPKIRGTYDSDPGKTNKNIGGIGIENLSFKYNALSNFVIEDINLHIPHGKVTAIVGLSGSGKTTLIKLLLGFYTPTRGRISVDGLDLAIIKPAEWRRRCGAVLQDGFIFSDTIANNISESDEYPEYDKLLHAIDMANIREMIDQLPLGLNTMIGAQGNGLSQGQRQRLLIARAIYKNPEYLFFDEATNALDANNERTIVSNLQEWFGMTADSASYSNRSSGSPTKTVVVVAHRLSTVRHADQIVVLDKGRIAEQGSHAELVSIKGSYYQLVKNQLELGS